MALSLILLLCFGTVPPSSSSDASARDKAKLQGSWVVIAAHRKGEPVREEECALMSLTFSGDKVVMKIGGKPTEKTFRLDASKKPATIDFANPNNAANLGIYKFQGDELTICFERFRGIRPTDFDTKGGQYRVRLILHKED